jgi:alkylated DNA repair dioxygenase AlkB
MELFFEGGSPVQLLPYGGSAEYHGPLFDQEKSLSYFNRLMQEIDWRHDEVRLYGKTIVTKRKVAWYGDKPYVYVYSKTEKVALPWTDGLGEIKSVIEKRSGLRFNSCLLNLYHSGEEGMSWHSDDEASLSPEAPIASVSFGAVRKFSFRDLAEGNQVSVMLENGSLLVMDSLSQHHWQHALPVMKRVREPRINLTFRSMLEQE